MSSSTINKISISRQDPSIIVGYGELYFFFGPADRGYSGGGGEYDTIRHCHNYHRHHDQNEHEALGDSDGCDTYHPYYYSYYYYCDNDDRCCLYSSFTIIFL